MASAREHSADEQPDAPAGAGLDSLPPRRDHGDYLTRLIVKTGDKVVILKTAEIDAIESAGNNVAVQSGKENHVLRATLSALETELDPKKFLRISRSAIVNLDRVKELLPMFKGEHVMVLNNGKQFAMTLGLREAEQVLKFS